MARYAQHGLIILAVALILVAGLTSSLWLGARLDRNALQVWRENARYDAGRLTDVISIAIDRARGVLRGTSMALAAPENRTSHRRVLSDEAFKWASLRAQGWNEPSFFDIVAYASRIGRNARAGMETALGGPLTLVGESTEKAPFQFESFAVLQVNRTDGFLRRLDDLASHREIREAVVTAYRSREQVAVGPVFKTLDGELRLAMAYYTPNAGDQGVVVGLFNLSDLLQQILLLQTPRGFSLRLARREGEVAETTVLRPILGSLERPKEALESFQYRVAYSLANWRINWDVLPEYREGPTSNFASSVRVGGAIITLLFAALLGILGLQNIRIKRRVRQRTVELAQARDVAERANRSKSAFLATMSHELRTPLNAIIGFSDVIGGLRGTSALEKSREYAKDIRQSGIHLLGIINDILDLSKAEAGKLQLQEGHVDLATVITACINMIAEQAEQSGVAIETDMPATPPAIRGDEQKLRQAMLNLLSNALKFTPHGGTVTVRVRQRKDGTVDLAVIDNGIGMRKEEIPLALENFGQVDNSLQRKYHGTGLGLPLVRSIVELHGGAISVESEQDKGTAVTLTLPGRRALVPGLAD